MLPAASALAGSPATVARNVSRSSANRRSAVTARTVAVLGTSRSSAISPKKSPGPSVRRVSTSAWPVGDYIEVVAGIALFEHGGSGLPRVSRPTLSQAARAPAPGAARRSGRRAEARFARSAPPPPRRSTTADATSGTRITGRIRPATSTVQRVPRADTSGGVEVSRDPSPAAPAPRTRRRRDPARHPPRLAASA